MGNKYSDNKRSEGVKAGDPKPNDAAGETERGRVEQEGYEEERWRRNQEWSPTQDSEYQTGGSFHSEEDAESKKASG